MNKDTLLQVVRVTSKQLSDTTTGNERILKKNASLKAIERLLKNLYIDFDVLTLEEVFYKEWSK